MADINTGYARNKILNIIRGVSVRSYNICDGFTPVGDLRPLTRLSDGQFATLSDTEYQRRLAQFIEYVYSLEDGLSRACPDMTIGSVNYNPVQCPLYHSEGGAIE